MKLTLMPLVMLVQYKINKIIYFMFRADMSILVQV